MELIKANINSNRPHSRNVISGALDKFVGPFIYFDHLGPYDFAAGCEVYIPPHPHAGIATISYMFSGEGNHRDSLGNEQVLTTGRVNYMNAGNGIIHSEGLSKNFSKKGGHLLGVQIWHLLSANERNNKAGFQSYSKTQLGSIALSDTCNSVVLMGNYQDTFSPVKTEREMLLMTIEPIDKSNVTIQLNNNWQYLLYSCDGGLLVADTILKTGEGLFIENNKELSVELAQSTKAILMGGPVLNEEPIFSASLVAVGKTQMQHYYELYSNGKFGTLA
jgi:redox-sensitive bicupin YhaK (pirin superfamily)